MPRIDELAANGTRMPLIIVTGLPGKAAAVVAESVRQLDPAKTALVHHGLRDATHGMVRRHVVHDDCHDTMFELAHGCPSCILRGNILPMLGRLSRDPDVHRIVLHLDPALEPGALCWAVRNVVRGPCTLDEVLEVHAVITVIDTATWWADASSPALLDDRGLPAASDDDDRSLAHLALSQVEAADALVVAGTAPDGRTTAALDRLAPDVPRIARTLVELNNPNEAGRRFVVKQYPKNAEYRHLRLRAGLVERLGRHIAQHGLGDDDLLFTYPGWTARMPENDADPPEQIVAGRKTGHGLRSKYNRGCRCQRCRTAYARFRARRRAHGKDHTRTQRLRDTDGHLGRDWFRRQICYPALAKAGISRRVRMHDLRHTHASWLLAGGADVETVRERLGHTSLRATERYLHTLPDFTDTAITALDTIRGAA